MAVAAAVAVMEAALAIIAATAMSVHVDTGRRCLRCAGRVAEAALEAATEVVAMTAITAVASVAPWQRVAHT